MFVHGIVQAPQGVWHPSMILEKSVPEVVNRWRKSPTFWGFFGKKTPYGQIFTCFPKWQMSTRKHVFLCKFREIWLTGSWWNRALFNGQKKQNFGSRSCCRFCVDRAHNLSGTAANNIVGVPQISPKYVHFRRSYSWTRERRSNVPQSVSNTRRTFSFFAEKYYTYYAS